MPFQFTNNPKEYEKLNGYLTSNSFITGFLPSIDDVKIFDMMTSPPDSKYSHILRWYNNIGSYTKEQRNNFGKKVDRTHVCSATKTCPVPKPTACPMPPKAAAKPAADDDDVDLFASDDEESQEAAAIREKRLKEYADKKSKKPALIAKSSVVLDVKPWDDETDMKEMENKVRSIEMDGLVWGASKLVPVGYGIHKLQIMSVVEDDKVSIDQLTEMIQEFEDFVQSVDIAAFNKI